MTITPPTPLYADEEPLPPAGHPERFGTRWRLIGAGLSNVWRYGDLVLDATSGRLLLRGPNGTGKTTALEALWPYLLDLNPQRLAAGKARTTSLSSLMRDGATGKRRYGYIWLSFAGPGSEGTHTYGVRLQFSAGASPAVKVIPFTVPGLPITDVPLHDIGRAPLTLERFTEIIDAAGGQVFEDDDAYVIHLAARVWGTGAGQLRDLAQRIRAVRNPSLLGDVSPRAAAEALREALPGVANDIITATAEALAESDATREAFTRDSEAADVLDEFADTWAGHVTAVIADAHQDASDAVAAVAAAAAETSHLTKTLAKARRAESDARNAEQTLRDELRDVKARIAALEDDDDFKAAGKIVNYSNQLGVQHKHAATTLTQLTNTTTAVRTQAASLVAQLSEVADELSDHTSAARTADAAAAPDGPLLAWSSHPRAVMMVAGTPADPGPTLTVDADPDRLSAIGERWRQLAHQHSVRAGAAQLAMSDFTKTVHPAQETARKAKDTATQAARDADAATQAEDQAIAVARTAATALLDAVEEWPISPPDLYDGYDDQTEEDEDDVFLWTTSDLDDLRTSEPGQVLNEVREWRDLITGRAARVRAAALEQRKRLLDQARSFTDDAAARRAEATRLRSGELLPLPRPAWLDSDDDTVALAAALDWAPTFTDPHARALVETALAASGLLSATLTDDSAVTSAWQVRPSGVVVQHNLSAVLAVDDAHPRAGVAADVLARIALLPAATDKTENDAALLIGRDGTFRAGPLFGRAPGADDPGLLPAAQHVGATQRRAAALARAEELDNEAAELDAAARANRDTADQLRRRAGELTEHAKSFPPLTSLDRSEAERIATAKEAARLHGVATEAHAEALASAEHAAERLLEWADRTRANSLPTDTDALTGLHERSTTAASALNEAATAVAGRLRLRLGRLLNEIATLHRTVATLPGLRSEAQLAHDAAASTETTIRTLEETVGQAAQKARDDHATACVERDRLEPQIDPARNAVDTASAAAAKLDAQLEIAQRTEHDVQPTADASRDRLLTLLAVPGVTDVLLEQADASAVTGENVIDLVTDALRGRRTYGRKTLRERYDTARAALAGMWTLDPADSYGDLDTFVLTHDDIPFTPVTAAHRAQELKAKAQAALDAAEESALRDFVIGRLPSAIGTAWTRLRDWTNDVNRKMRSAAASSGVGVQVRIRLADDLSPASRTVYELACKVSDADRTRDQQTAIGRALQQLIAAADGETMVDKLAAAVDIRGWVDVNYGVTRPGADEKPWSSKTGLSGGERRLVVLAPMIAAVAAAYDNFASTGLRLVSLDEVPAEVDERGREGLARYLAELDLDLVCTSYLWDGAPGAWDGVDAHDLEAAADGTVVAFPMLIRGLHDLPGDQPLEPNA